MADPESFALLAPLLEDIYDAGSPDEEKSLKNHGLAAQLYVNQYFGCEYCTTTFEIAKNPLFLFGRASPHMPRLARIEGDELWDARIDGGRPSTIALVCMECLEIKKDNLLSASDMYEHAAGLKSGGKIVCANCEQIHHNYGGRQLFCNACS